MAASRYFTQANPYTVSGFGVPRRQPRLRLTRGVGTAYGTYGGILSRSGVSLRLFAERQALHQASRAFGRSLRSLRASAESEWRGWKGECIVGYTFDLRTDTKSFADTMQHPRRPRVLSFHHGVMHSCLLLPSYYFAPSPIAKYKECKNFLCPFFHLYLPSILHLSETNQSL